MSKEDILNKKVDEKELKEVNGGVGAGADGHGGCSGAYYKEICSATVEKDSWCLSDDWCFMFDCTYSRTPEGSKEYSEEIRAENQKCQVGW